MIYLIHLQAQGEEPWWVAKKWRCPPIILQKLTHKYDDILIYKPVMQTMRET